MKAIDMNNTIVMGNKTMIRFTDWDHKSAELIMESVDEHTAHVYGTVDGVEACASISEDYDGVRVVLTIKDMDRKGINVLSQIHVSSELFAEPYNEMMLGSVVKAAQEAVQNALTYASLWKNETGVGIEKLQNALRTFENAFHPAVDEYLVDRAKVPFFQEAATLVAV